MAVTWSEKYVIGPKLSSSFFNREITTKDTNGKIASTSTKSYPKENYFFKISFNPSNILWYISGNDFENLVFRKKLSKFHYNPISEFWNKIVEAFS